MPLERCPAIAGAPASWLVQNLDLLEPGWRALDVAAGRGRHALALAAAGLRVTAVDRDQRALAALREAAARHGLEVDARAMDLEGEGVDLGEALYDVVLVMHYLHRPLFPALRRSIRPGGLLVYETFTVRQATLGRPSNPAFLLESGELLRLVEPCEVIRAREGLFDGRWVASVVARRPASTSPDACGAPPSSASCAPRSPDAGRR